MGIAALHPSYNPATFDSGVGLVEAPCADTHRFRTEWGINGFRRTCPEPLAEGLNPFYEFVIRTA